MIYRENELFVLETKDTTYCFRVLVSGHLEHLYYGKKLNLQGGYTALTEKNEFPGGNHIVYSKNYPSISLENLCLEMSSLGKGDIREPFIEITHGDGTTTSDFLFKDAKIMDEKEALTTLPSAYMADDESEKSSLEVMLYDEDHQITLFLVYSVFYNTNVITRSARVWNNSKEEIQLNRIMSGQLDLDTSDYMISTFHGAWAREMGRYDTKVQPGRIVIDSKAGTSSSRSNPFFMVSEEGTNEDSGNCYGFNLVYSGNHYGTVEGTSVGKLHIIHGISPMGFRFLLQPGDKFEAPESVMTFSNRGYNGMSHNMHNFIRNHIVRGQWKEKERPVLINSWEANYFKFNDSKLLKQAKAAKEAGIELFVLDDGWFGKRNDDTSSLGDWTENKEKLKDGLKGLADKINELGMEFGIWVEPEMVNEDSECYRNHPDWAVHIKGTKQSLGRNQMILDITREEVRNYIVGEMIRVFNSANITYVKWDMNRIFSDCYSPSLDARHQGEFSHRYIMGLYKVLDVITNMFPHILFESCASGGNRFDLGMLCYTPQIWASDNTDAICRAKIQTGYSYGYPMSVMGAHVSGCPNHQTLRNTPLDTRFEVASFGLLGYELNIDELNSEDKKAVRDQIEFYKGHRRTLQFGDYYRIKNGDTGAFQWISVDKEKDKALGLYLQKEVIPGLSYGKFVTKGLEDGKLYHFTNRQQIFNIKEFGDLINMISPIHIKQDSIMHNVIAKIKKMPGEIEDCTAYGDVFNYAGVKLKQGFAGTGYNENVRLFQDFSSRMYIWNTVESEAQI